MKTTVLEKVRIEKDLSKAKLCRLADIKEPTYEAIIKGKSSPKIIIIERICKALDINPGELWADDQFFVKESENKEYKECKGCAEKVKIIKELMRTIGNLNTCVERLTQKKSTGHVG